MFIGRWGGEGFRVGGIGRQNRRGLLQKCARLLCVTMGHQPISQMVAAVRTGIVTLSLSSKMLKRGLGAASARAATRPPRNATAGETGAVNTSTAVAVTKQAVLPARLLPRKRVRPKRRPMREAAVSAMARTRMPAMAWFLGKRRMARSDPRRT